MACPDPHKWGADDTVFITSFIIIIITQAPGIPYSEDGGSKECCCQARPLERVSQVESQPDKSSYLLDARLNDSKTSRETREMKGRDSPCWRYHPTQYICQTCSPQVTPAIFCNSGGDWEEIQRREIIQRMFRWAGAGCS